MPHKKKIRRQVSRRSSSFSISDIGSFHDKLKWLTLCLFCLAIFNFTILHVVQSTIIDFYDGESSFLSFSEDLVASWDPTTYSDDKSILPQKIITVIGKESSGTTFVAKTIAQSLGLPGRQKYRDGFYHQERKAYDELPTQIQHVSLPQGAWCLQNHSHHIVDVILPPHCVTGKNGKFPSEKFPGIRQQCESLLNSTIIGKNAFQLFEGMMEMHGPWFMKNSWKNGEFYYKAGRYPGRVFAQTDKVKSRNVTVIRGKRGGDRRRKDNWEMRRQERREYYREQLLETVDSVPEPRDADLDPPPLIVQRGNGNADKKKFDTAPRNFPDQESTNRRLTEEEEEEKKIQEKNPGDNNAAAAKDGARGPIKYRFEGGEVKQVKQQRPGLGEELRKRTHHPPKHRAFRHDMTNLTVAQKEELKRRMRIVDGQAVPSDDNNNNNNNNGPQGEETPNEKLRRENRERKRQMLIKEHEERIKRMHSGGEISNDDGPRLHGKRPSRLSRQQRIDEWLGRLKLHPLDHLQENNLLMYPSRFLLNITAQKIWYDAHGTEQVIVIVVRDEEMSLKSRLKSHCHILELAKEEEGIANAILNDAIQTFFLNDKSGFSSGFGGRWYGKTVEEIRQEKFMWDPTPIIENKTIPGDPLYSSLIPASNNVILVSYEAMMKYQQDYVSELYKVLGIQSNFKPVFVDGNAKYRNASQAGSIGRRPEEMSGYMNEDGEEQGGVDSRDGGGHGFFFRWLLRQPEEYQGILLAISCASVFGSSFSLWVFIFWLFFRRTVKKRKDSSRGRGRKR